MFAEEYHNLVEETKVTIRNSGFHSENVVQEIGGTLEHLILEAEVNKDIFMKLTDVFKALRRNNASLTTQLSDVMKIILEMAKKMNLKATHNPEDKKLVDKSNRKAAFEKNLDSDSYCWTNGYRVTKQHSSQTFPAPVPGHQRQPIQKDVMGGSKEGK